MDIASLDFIESCAIKSEVILTETFSFCGKYEDCGSNELKTEPVNYEETLKHKEGNDLAEPIDIHAAPMQQDFCDDSNFTTMGENSQIELLRVTKNVKYSCKGCNFTTQLDSSIKEHIKIHNDRYNIEECNFKMPQIFSLSTELKTPRTENEYFCNECNYTTLNKDCLRKHVKIHKGTSYNCEKCDYKTIWKNNLKEHVKIHTGGEYKYKECDYKTVWKNNLKEHVKIHTGDEYKCKECDYKTVRRNLLKEHLKIHTGEKYNCKECDYKTIRKSDLMQHVKIHTGNRYKCKECDYKTVRKSYLKHHARIHTGDEYKCKDCDYKTIWKNLLKEHLKIHTGEKYKCKNVIIKQYGNIF
ncbi:hypothetical protein FQA39_LY10520 [Lamprigera yunnana]|nr:hypothetical protein FQA39_LY10520 [Lamprigera yunnana]